MLAHLSRKKLVRCDFRTGACVYKETKLAWSGTSAAGDEITSPVCTVIDVGRDFTMTFDSKLYLVGEGKGRFETFTPSELRTLAWNGYFGFTLLWDLTHDQEETAEEAVSI